MRVLLVVGGDANDQTYFKGRPFIMRLSGFGTFQRANMNRYMPLTRLVGKRKAVSRERLLIGHLPSHMQQQLSITLARAA